MDWYLIQLIKKEIPNWRSDFGFTEEADPYTHEFEFRSIRKPEKYKKLFFGIAEKRLGIYFESIDGPTDNFGESDESWYEKRLFYIEMTPCPCKQFKFYSKVDEFKCPVGVKGEFTDKGYYLAKGFTCPDNCELEAHPEFFTLHAHNWKDMIEVTTFCLKNYKLTTKQKNLFQDNLEVFNEYLKISHSGKEEEENELQKKYGFGSPMDYGNSKRNQFRSVSKLYPKIAREVKKYIRELKKSIV